MRLANYFRNRFFSFYIGLFVIFFTLPLVAKPKVAAKWGASNCPWSEDLSGRVWESGSFKQLLEVAGIEQDLHPITVTSKEEEVPVLIIFSEEGKELGRVGYLMIPPEKYVELFKEILSIHSMASLFQSLEKEQLLVMYRKAQLFQMKEYEDRLLEIGLSKDPAVDFLIEKYAKELKAHSRKAHKIKSEIRKRTDQSIEAEWEMALLLFEARKKKYQDTVRIAAPLEKFLRRYGSSDPKTLWKCYFVLAEFYKSRGDLQKADQNVEGALRGAPTELHSFISRLKDKRS